MTLDLQFLLGLLLYGVLSPITWAAFHDIGAAMKDSIARFWTVEHAFGMIVAIALAHIGRSRVHKTGYDGRRHKLSAIFFTLALLIILASIPWPSLAHGRPCCDGRWHAPGPQLRDSALQQRRDHRLRGARHRERSRSRAGTNSILVNDGSADATSDVCRRSRAHAPASRSRLSSTRATSASTTPSSPAGATPAAPTSSTSTTTARIRRPKRCGCGSTRRARGSTSSSATTKSSSTRLWRNVGSWFTNRMTDWALDKPPGFYLSSFRCVSAFVAQAGRRLRRSVSVHRRAAAAGDAAHRIDQRAARRAPRGPEQLHAAPADSAVAERVGELLAAAAARRDGRRRRHRGRRARWRSSSSSGCGCSNRGPALRLGLGDGGGAGVFGHAARACSASSASISDGCS